MHPMRCWFCWRALSASASKPPTCWSTRCSCAICATVEEGHAEFWKRKIGAVGQRVPSLRPSFRTRALAWLARRFGPAFVLPSINTLEQMDSGTYDKQPEAVAGGLPAAERSHARIIEALAAPSPGAFSGPTIARLEGRHRAMGDNALRR